MPTTSSRLPVLILAIAALITGRAAADAPPATLPDQAPPTSAPAPAASTDQPATPDDAELFARVGRLLQSRCAMPGCHLGPDAMKGLHLEIQQIYRSSVNVRARTDPRLLRLVPGAPRQSLLYLKLLPPDQGGYRGPRMPQGMNPLKDEEITLVHVAIHALARGNGAGEGVLNRMAALVMAQAGLIAAKAQALVAVFAVVRRVSG